MISLRTFALSLLLLPACDGGAAVECQAAPDVAALVASADAGTLDALAADVCPEDAAPSHREPRLAAKAQPAGYDYVDTYPDDPFAFGCTLPSVNIADLSPQSCAIMLAACVDAQIGPCQGQTAKECAAAVSGCVESTQAACWDRL